MKQYWIRWEKWMSLEAPKLLNSLNPGATEVEFNILEKLINKELPTVFKEFYAIHNGQKESHSRIGLIDSDELMSISSICFEWSSTKEFFEEVDMPDIELPVHEGIKNDWWNPLWIPITNDRSGNYICMDLDPATGGTYGQMITTWHDSNDKKIVSASFEDWVASYVQSLENGSRVYAPKWGIVEKDSVFNTD